MLTGKQRRHLRALAHVLKPIVQVGKDGIGEGVAKAIDQALTDHELIKVKVADGSGLDRHEAAAALASQTRSEVAQVLGYTVLLYRANPEDPQIVLPKAKASATGGDAEGDDADDDADDADDDADE